MIRLLRYETYTERKATKSLLSVTQIAFRAYALAVTVLE